MIREKFKLETKKGQIVYRISLNIHSGQSKGCLEKEGLFVETLKIVHQTKHKIVLSDPFVTVLDRQKESQRKESYFRFLEDVSVNIRTQETYFANGIFCLCFTIEPPEKTIKIMKHKIITKIENEYGFLRDMDIERKVYDMEVSTLPQ